MATMYKDDIMRSSQAATEGVLNKARSKTKAYTGPQYVTKNGLNVDMNRDYSEVMNGLDPNDTASRRVVETYRNAKKEVLRENGANDYGPNTNQYADASLADTSAYKQRYDTIAGNAEKNRDNLVAAAEAQANLAGQGYDAQQEQLDMANEDNMRQIWVNSQLAKKRLKEALAARGITGGSAESAAADILAAYQQNIGANAQNYIQNSSEIAQQRAAMQNTLAEKTAAIRATYGDDIANAYLEYQQNVAAAEGAAAQNIANRLGILNPV